MATKKVSKQVSGRAAPARTAAAKPARSLTAAKTTRSARAPESVEDGQPLYEIVREPSYIDNRLVPVGETVVYYGLPGRTLKPVNALAIARKRAVRAINEDGDLDAEEKYEQLKALSDEWNGVEEADREDIDGLDDEDDADELSDEERAELERHARAAVAATVEKNADNTNVVGVQLQGKNEPDPAALQGATPKLDEKGETAQQTAAKA